MDRLTFHADRVAVDSTDYGDDYRVHSAHFGTGDPEVDGHHWHFSRCFRDDDGVCTSREIQQATLYEGIRTFQVSRTNIRCIFESSGAREVGIRELSISFEVDDAQWRRLSEMLDVVFRDKPYYRRTGADRSAT